MNLVELSTFKKRKRKKQPLNQNNNNCGTGFVFRSGGLRSDRRLCSSAVYPSAPKSSPSSRAAAPAATESVYLSLLQRYFTSSAAAAVADPTLGMRPALLSWWLLSLRWSSGSSSSLFGRWHTLELVHVSIFSGHWSSIVGNLTTKINLWKIYLFISVLLYLNLLPDFSRFSCGHVIPDLAVNTPYSHHKHIDHYIRVPL
ncbi:uncharacterized protein [Triticum aestivum]|uniref:uncharacterized protein n=1 Tax=Triticum aestivum TaxID=4565 RepID=UPI001D0315DC|nr:uncharacterized protein LOC123120597 [Triticum aestivum]